MKCKFSFLSLFVVLPLKAKVATAASMRGAAETTNNDQNLSLRFLSQERRLLPFQGVMRTLILRVTDSQGSTPVTDARRQSDVWFGTHDMAFAGNLNSMASLYDQCSGGKLMFVPATGPDVVDGVFEITVDQGLAGLDVAAAGNVVKNNFNALNANLGIEFEAYSIILPTSVGGGGGLARKGGSYQMYVGGAERSLELVMHEFGHNLDFHHSGLPDEGEYDDNSCLMGCCAGAQQMCFNAAKSWYAGWYSEEGKEGYENLNHFDTPGQWWKGKLVGVDDYLKGVFDESQHRVVVRLTGGLFMMFNRKKGINGGVKGEVKY